MTDFVNLRPTFKSDEAKLDQKKNVPVPDSKRPAAEDFRGSGDAFRWVFHVSNAATDFAPDKIDWLKIFIFPEYDNMKALVHVPPVQLLCNPSAMANSSHVRPRAADRLDGRIMTGSERIRGRRSCKRKGSYQSRGQPGSLGALVGCTGV
jgi:hypothetical protein